MPSQPSASSFPLLDQPRLRAWLQRKLLAWFQKSARDLPWRKQRDPYSIWVSEVMLQQTQVATVIAYFNRFLAKFPDLASLAAADQQEVLRLWEGLGYYRRARDLHRAAQLMVEQNGGAFPRDVDHLRTFPGLGRYTANAVLSQAFDQRLPILEANSVRLLCRLLGVRGDPKKTETQKFLWQAAETLLPLKNVGDFNQALMELGALICSPQDPACGECPLALHCTAFQLGKQDEMPGRSPRPVVEEVREVAVVLWKKGEVFLVQRPATGRWANLWEFPHRPVIAPATHEETARQLCDDLGFAIALKAELATIRHGVTRFRIELTCLEAEHRKGQFQSKDYSQGLWLTPDKLHEYPISRPQRRLVHKLLEVRQPRLF